MSIIEDARPILSDLLVREEGLRLRAYLCSAGVPTIGVGATTYPDGRRVSMSDPPITKARAMEMLAEECDRFLSATLEMCTRYPTVNQLAALASLAYNIGVNALRRSTVLRLHNAGDAAGAARAFALWNKARVNGQLQPLRGLTARRARESALYLTPDPGESIEPVPQAVAEESKLIASPIAQGGGVAAVGGTSLGLLALPEQVQQASTVVETGSGMVERIREATGVEPALILALAVAAAGVYVMVWRKRQRDGGWT